MAKVAMTFDYKIHLLVKQFKNNKETINTVVKCKDDAT